MPACISIHKKSELKAMRQIISVSCLLHVLIFGTNLIAYVRAEADKLMLAQDLVEIPRV